MVASTTNKRKWLLVVSASLFVVSGAAALLYWRLAGPRIVDTRNALGQVERCTSCHPGGARKPGGPSHPKVNGHATLVNLGCTPCHGGQALATEAEVAHSPDLGGAPDPFVPLGWVQLTCARCHVPGRLEGGEHLASGQRNYLAASCASCHQPGGHPQRIGLDLRLLPQRTADYLRSHLTDPRALNPDATMWTLRDRTYRGRFADSPEGRKNTDALIVYSLALADRIQRERWAPAQHPKQLRIDRSCTDCHHVDRAQTSGKAHVCPALDGHKALRCGRCHERDRVPADRLDRLCPQVRGEIFSCGTCHFRQADGAADLLRAALVPEQAEKPPASSRPSAVPSSP